MQIQQNISLKKYNSFGIDASARYFAPFSSTEELLMLDKDRWPTLRLVLGGGSNILLRGEVDGLVLKNEIRGIDLIREDENYVFIKAGAGENWHQFVLYCLQRNWAGVENLSLIPGSVGAGPMQNIGAYGVELKDVFYELEAFDIRDLKVYTFSLNDCAFGYRESVFKKRYRDRFIILSVTLRLYKKPRFNTSYGAIQEELTRMGVAGLSIQAVSEAVIRIRTSKLPDPSRLGNAGSFFKNPQVTEEKFNELKNVFPGMVGHPGPSGQVKLAAGWMIEQCGWKGFRRGDAGCHEKQALVLVNFGQASGQEIYSLSEEILQSVKARFGVELEREVNIL